MTTISEYFTQLRSHIPSTAFMFAIVYVLLWLFLDASLVPCFIGFLIGDFGYWHYSNKVKK